MTRHTTPLFSKYEFPPIKTAPGPEKYNISLFATKMSCFQSCRGVTILFLLLSTLTIPMLAQEVSPCTVKKTPLTVKTKRC